MGGGRRLRCLVAALAALAAVAGLAAPRAAASTISFGSQPGTLISIGGSSSGESDSLEVNFQPSTSPMPTRFTIEVPAGYTLDLDGAPGTEVAAAAISVIGVDQPSFASGFGDLVTDDPAKYVTDPAAQACAPGLHAAVWTASTSIAGQKVDLRVFVDAGGAAGVAYTLQACPTGLAGVNTNSAVSIGIEGLETVHAPRAAGRYVWRTTVTPQSGQAYELQAVVPLPASVVVASRYDRKTHEAVVTGRAVAGGKPIAKTYVFLSAENGSLDGPNLKKTGADGRFTFRVPLKRTTDLVVGVAPGAGPCEEAPVALGGCLSSTTVPPDPGSTTIWVSLPGGPVRATRPADQRRAVGETVGFRDLPSEFEIGGDVGHPCESQKHESDLTITGESESPGFLKYSEEPPPKLMQVNSLVRVYRTARQARAAFEREAVPATARCELGATGIEGAKSRKIRPYRLAGLAASTRGFRTLVPATKTLKASIDTLFLKRGRSVVRLRLVLIAAPAGFERTLAAKLAARMR